MNKDLTVLTIALMLIFLDGMGAWHFLPDGYRRWTSWETLFFAGILTAVAGILIRLTFLILRRIIARFA